MGEKVSDMGGGPRDRGVRSRVSQGRMVIQSRRLGDGDMNIYVVIEDLSSFIKK